MISGRQPFRTLAAAATLALSASLMLSAQRGGTFTGSRDHPAIGYTTAEPRDPIALLSKRLEAGEVRLERDPDSGYLRSVLAALKVPITSQVVVFSQTSKQADVISAANPRALYFNDTTAVGWVRGADDLELMANDPVIGPVFYTLSQNASEKPRFVRDLSCLQCHQTFDTLGVPGWTAISTFSAPVDKYSYATGTTVDHRVPFSERWGGWFVTGGLGRLRHLGNDTDLARPANRVAAAVRELASLDRAFDTRGFVSRRSDVASMMLLEHQVTMVNLLVRTGWEARVAPNGAAVADAAVELVDYLLFVDEAPLTGGVTSDPEVRQTFEALGPTDSRGRSLRQLDLKTRLLRYPCSYLIYSPLFEELPAAAKTAVYDRLWRVLSGAETGDVYNRLEKADRVAITEILRDTKPDLPDYFKADQVR